MENIALRIIRLEYGHTLLEQVVLVVVDERGAHTQTLLVGTGGDEADGRHTVVHQLARQLTARHTGIADSEVETVGDGLVEVLVVDHVETVATENLLQTVGTVGIDLDLATEIVGAVARCLEHRCQSKLCAVARARRQGVEHTGREHQTEGQSLVATGERWEMAVEQSVGDAGDADALAGIAEGLRTADEQHIVVGIASITIAS